jgi:hypothetical protein
VLVVEDEKMLFLAGLGILAVLVEMILSADSGEDLTVVILKIILVGRHIFIFLVWWWSILGFFETVPIVSPPAFVSPHPVPAHLVGWVVECAAPS